jgi:hypothetical protein
LIRNESGSLAVLFILPVLVIHRLVFVLTDIFAALFLRGEWMATGGRRILAARLLIAMVFLGTSGLIGFPLAATIALGAFRLGVCLTKMAFLLLFPFDVPLGLALLLVTTSGRIALIWLTLLLSLAALIALALLALLTFLVTLIVLTLLALVVTLVLLTRLALLALLVALLALFLFLIRLCLML